MDPGITEIAAQLAEEIPTGASSAEEAKQDWRTTLYNAERTRSMGPLTELIERSSEADASRSIVEVLRRR